jgi:hypothetical protein
VPRGRSSGPVPGLPTRPRWACSQHARLADSNEPDLSRRRIPAGLIPLGRSDLLTHRDLRVSVASHAPRSSTARQSRPRVPDLGRYARLEHLPIRTADRDPKAQILDPVEDPPTKSDGPGRFARSL